VSSARGLILVFTERDLFTGTNTDAGELNTVINLRNHQRNWSETKVYENGMKIKGTIAEIKKKNESEGIAESLLTAVSSFCSGKSDRDPIARSEMRLCTDKQDIFERDNFEGSSSNVEFEVSQLISDDSDCFFA